MLGSSAVEAIHLTREMMEYYRIRKRELHMIFVDLEKANDKVSIKVVKYISCEST